MIQNKLGILCLTQKIRVPNIKLAYEANEALWIAIIFL